MAQSSRLFLFVNTMSKFEKLGLNKGLCNVLDELKFSEPTEIQEKTIPLVMQGKDVIGKSATGSGKTLAFGCVIIEKTIKKKGVQNLVLVPTRELAEQVTQAIRKFGKSHGLSIVDVYGGVSINTQIRNLEKAEIVVGTPGRILDHINRRTIDLSNVNVLVLDEADRMVDMGFLPDVEKIISFVPEKRQTLLFSATITQDIGYIEKKYMLSPKYIAAESYVDPSKLKQIYYDVPSNMKFSLLVHLLKHDKSQLVMVFCNTRRTVDFVSLNLKKLSIKSMAIHGGLTQNKRSFAIEKFHEEKVQALVCTDVAARGLDINNVTHIYNFDIPKNSNDYIHRIGRTARAGKEGEAISIVSQMDYENFRHVLQDDSLKIEQVQTPKVEQIMVRFSSEPRDSFRDSRGPRRYNDRSRGTRSGGSPRSDRSSGRFNDRSNRSRSDGGRPSRFGDRRGSSFGGSSQRGRSFSSGQNRASSGGPRRSSHGR